MTGHNSFKHWLKEKWYEHLDEVEEWTGKRPEYQESEYFAKYKWWLKREYLHQKRSGNVD